MGSFIFTIVFAVAAVIGLTVAIRAKENRWDRWIGIGVTVVAGLVAGLIGFFSTFTQIDANTVGIVTSFGQPSGTIEPGAHMLAPWDKVDTFSTRIQTSVRTAAVTEGDQKTRDCVTVALKGGSAACPDVTIRYAISDHDAVDLWKRFGSFDAVRDQLVRSSTTDSARFVFGQYEPTAAISGETLRTITADFTKDITARLSTNGVRVDSVSVGGLNLDPKVQANLDALLQAQADTKVAEQNIAKNQAQAKANDALTASLTGPVLTEHCIDAAKEFKPSYYNCFPNAGGATPLINIGPGH